jgi:hypothetical protein
VVDFADLFPVVGPEETMLHIDRFRKLHEVYEVEKEVEVVVSLAGESTAIRIVALKSGHTGKYLTRAYRSQIIHLSTSAKPDDAGAGELASLSGASIKVWVEYALPWTDGESADDVLEMALTFLEARCD